MMFEQMPGVRCQGCAARGQETWVIPGKACHVCGTECSRLALNDGTAIRSKLIGVEICNANEGIEDLLE
jgi:hypothetical protein